MGSTFGFSSRAEVVRYAKEAAGRDLVTAVQRGGNLWMLVRNKANRHGIVLALIKSYKGDYGVKFIDESQGPSEVDCPLSLLDRADAEPTGSAADWRRRVRAFQKAKAEVAPGLVLKVGEFDYKLDRRLDRGGWAATRTSDNQVFRIPTATLLRNLPYEGAS